MEQNRQTEQLTLPADNECPALPEVVDVEQRLNQTEAVALAKQCNQLGRNRREVSGRIIVIFLTLVFAVPAGLMISEAVSNLNAARKGTADLLPMVVWLTNFAIPCVSLLMVIAILFSMTVKFTDADPPFGNTTKIHLGQHAYEAEWTAESGRSVSLMVLWSQAQVRWSNDAWLIRSHMPMKQFLVKRESLSPDHQQQLQTFFLELTDWQQAHPNPTQHNDIFPPLNEHGVSYQVRIEQQPELTHLTPQLESLDLVRVPFVRKQSWAILLWIAVLSVSGLVYPVYSMLILKQGIGLTWMLSIVPIWLLYKLYRITNQPMYSAFQLDGRITPTGIWIQTAGSRWRQSFAGLQNCYRLDHALLLSWGKTNECLVILKSSFAQETDWHAGCRQIEAATTVRSV